MFCSTFKVGISLRCQGTSSYLFTVRHLSSYNSKSKFVQICNSPDEAIKDVKSNSTILAGGFGLCGIPENLISAISKKKLNNLTVVSNNVGVNDFGLGILIQNNQIKRVIASYVGENKHLQKQYFEGDIELELIPQGTLVEKIRAGGAGIPMFYTPTGYNTLIHHGGLAIKYDKNGNVSLKSKPKNSVRHNNKNFLLEESITGDVAIIKAYKADSIGNLTFRKSARNYNVAMCKAAKLTIAEVEEIVPTGQLDPDNIHVPAIYVDRLVKGNKYEKRIEKVTTRQNTLNNNKKQSESDIKRSKIAQRAALELKDGMFVNLGVGIPVLVANYLSPDISVSFHSENGVSHMGPYPDISEVDADLINAGKETVTVLPGASFFSSDESFAMIRGGHLDCTILGAFQVSKFGDLANWTVPGKLIKGFGGAADLSAASIAGTKVIVTMDHCNKEGKSKIVEECTYPLTCSTCVSKIITEKAVFEFLPEKGITLTEIFNGNTVEHIKSVTGCHFAVSDELKVIH